MVRAISLVVGFLLVASSGQLQGALVNAVSFASVNTGSGGDGTFGWDFTTSAAVTVTDLGLWVSGFNGVDLLNDDHKVSIWDNANPATPLVTTTISSGAYTDNSFTYQSVTPTLLSPGTTYVIGAYYPTINDFYHLDGVNSNSLTFASEVSPGNYRFIAASDGFPSGSTGTTYAVGPTFRFDTTSAVPEPSTLAVFAIGGVGIIARRIRRRRKHHRFDL